MQQPYARPRLVSSVPAPTPQPLTPLQQRFYQDVARRLRRAKRQSGLESADIAAEVTRILGVQVSRSMVRRALEGQGTVHLDKLWAYARVLEVPLASLLPCPDLGGADDAA